MDSFKAFIEAMATVNTAPPPVDNQIDNNDDDNDDDWDCENIRKKYWDALTKWMSTSVAANQVRFNVFEAMLRKIRPQAKSMIWGSQGDHQHSRIIKGKGGYAQAELTWNLPQEGMLWDKIVEEQRSILNRSDVYKVFGNEGQKGSAAILFKGEALECIVYLCCALTGNISFGVKPLPFTENFMKLIESKFNTKLEEWLKERIIQRLRATLIVKNVRGSDLKLPNLNLTKRDQRGNVSAYNGDVVIKFTKTYQFRF